MSIGQFLSDQLGRLILQGVCLLLSSAFLAATGTQPGVILLLVIVLCLVWAAVQAHSFLKMRARLLELETLLDGLDQKYLFAECAPPSPHAYERRLLELMRRSGRAMTGAVSDAQAAQREYREYIEGWVHEIKTPITACRLLCQGLDSTMRRKLAQELTQIEAHVERALYYARAESPERDCLIRQASLADIVTEAIQNHRSLLIQNGVQIETEDLEQTVYTDSKWAVFIIGQLLQNAIRYRQQAPLLTISARPLGKLVQLSVCDNGLGIPAHELSRVFDRGFTGSNGRAKGSSTGMGLYLCKKLSGFLAIELSIRSKVGQGTEVVLTFPAKESLAPASLTKM